MCPDDAILEGVVITAPNDCACATHKCALDDAFEKAELDGRTDLLATALCTELCSELMDEGVEKLHFYTLNTPELTRNICHALGVTPEIKLENVA